jgi:tetratricopeptide (TPR) repeat protein
MAEKTINQIPRPLRESYEKGKSAFDRKNFDYAVEIFRGVLKQEPAFYDCREALRASQFKKAGGSTNMFKRMLSGAGSSPALAKGQLALMKNPVDALNIAEEILSSDPNSIAGHKLLGEAAMLADLPKTAILSLEIAVKNSPKDEEMKKNLARAYSAAGQGDKAETIFAELMRLHPADLRLVQELKDISAKKTLSEGGYEALAGGGGSYRDILKDKDRAVSMEQEGRQVKTEDVAQKMIADLEERLVAEPRNLKALRSVAELYDQQKNFDKALETYQRIIDSEGNTDASLQKVIAETTIKKLNHAITQLDAADPGFAETKKQLESERDAFLLADVEQRAEKYPNDLVIRFDLGRLYLQTGKIREAVKEFQKAQNNPNKHTQSLSYLGQCFIQLGFNDMAVRSLQNALKEKLAFDEEKKEMIYSLGSVLEKMGKKEEAMDQFKQIYEVDSGYKDIADKVEKYYSGGNA